MEMPNQEKTCKKCGCPHHKVVPFIILLIGILFLCQALNIFTAGFVAITWPILVIIGALKKMFGYKCGCCKDTSEVKKEM